MANVMKNATVFQRLKEKKRIIIPACIILVLVGLLVIAFFNRIATEYQMLMFGEVKLERGVYQGQTAWGRLDGDGELKFNSGETYNGDWIDGAIEGAGSLNYPDIGVYTGEFKTSQKCGNGSFLWNNGDQYSGSWDNDQLDGEGTYTFSNGGTLKGKFENNSFYEGTYFLQTDELTITVLFAEFQSQSVNFTLKDGTTYSGDCNAAVLSGKGEMTYPNGDAFSGEYQDGLRNGVGVYTWSNGDCYDGNWERDQMSGEGVYTFQSGAELIGAFDNNRFESGTYKATDLLGNYSVTITNYKIEDAMIQLNNGILYEGEFDGTYINGEGSITYANGDQYTGSFSEGKRNGQGTYTWRTGEKYSGNWVNDSMEGEGTYYYRSSDPGLKIDGHFASNMPDGDCQYYSSESQSYKTTWKNGKCVKVYE